MHRSVAVFLLFLTAAPADAWEFSATPVCTLSHENVAATLRIIHDPRLAEPYAITVTRPDARWPEGPVFSLAFEGPRANTISTRRHVLSEGGAALTVTDRGFGNLLDGLSYNDTATARLAGAELGMSLAGAGPAVAAFRACVATPVA